MRVLVTGGAGFIGSHVVDALRAGGHEPRLFDLRSSPHHAEGEIDTVIGSVLDAKALRAALEGCDAVAHLAAAADVDQVKERPAEAEELNARGTLNVLEAALAAGVDRVLFASTIWVYGSSAAGDAVDEETLLGAPDHLYTATKLGGEMYCRSYSNLYGLDCTILRFGIPYGPRARPAAVVPAFVSKALAGEPLTIAGTGEQCRRFVYVEDLAKGVVAALRPEAANRVYNLVGTEDVSIKRIAETVGEVVGNTRVVHTPARAGDFRGVEVSAELARQELGWHGSTPFAEGLRQYVDWHRTSVRTPSEEAPAGSVPAASRAARRTPALPARRIADGIAAAAVFLGTVGLLAAYLVALYPIDNGDTARTVLLASMAGVAAYSGYAREKGAGRTLSPALMWVVAAAGALALLLPGPRGLLDLAHPDAAVMLLCAAGASFAVALVAGGRRLLPRPPPDEQPQDSGL